MHSIHVIYGYMASGIWLRTIQIVRKETHCRHMGYSFRLTARVLLYAPSHSLCYTSRGALAGKRNSSMGPPHEGSIRRPIEPWANTLTTELHLAPHSLHYDPSTTRWTYISSHCGRYVSASCNIVCNLLRKRGSNRTSSSNTTTRFRFLVIIYKDKLTKPTQCVRCKMHLCLINLHCLVLLNSVLFKPGLFRFTLER